MTNGCSSKPIKTSGKRQISTSRIKDWNLDWGSWLFKNVLLFFFVAQMAHPSSHSPSLLWTHFMPLFLHLLFVCCRTVPASEFHPSSKPTNHGTPTEVPCDPHYLPVSSVCLCVYDFVCVCTGCFHIWRLSCVFLQAHSHALLIPPPSSTPVPPDSPPP